MAKPIRLIVNADDFGLAPAVNQAIAGAFDNGILRSTSLLAGGAFAEDAAAVAASRPGLGVGVHLALTQVSPVLPPSRVTALTGEGGAFPDGPAEVMTRLFAGKQYREEVAAEFAAQIGKALDLGINITHIDGHQHLHVLPFIRDIVALLAQRFQIPAVRLPRMGGPRRTYGAWCKALAIDAVASRAKRIFSPLRMTDAFWGLACSGGLDRDRLIRILSALEPGTHEIMTHPGTDDAELERQFPWGYQWEAELAALGCVDSLETVRRREIRLVNYREIVQ